MFGKSFEQKYTGSLAGSGPIVFAVWDYMITCARDGVVDVNPIVVAAVIGKMTPQDVSDAVDFLAQPDKDSRTADEEGRRIVQVGPLQWRLVNHEKYRAFHRAEQKRAADRDRQRSWRERKEGRNAPSVTERDKPKRVNGAAKKRAAAHALPADWKPNDKHAAKAAERGLDLANEAERFRNHAESTGRTCVKWDAAFNNWLLSPYAKKSEGGRKGAPARANVETKRWQAPG